MPYTSAHLRKTGTDKDCRLHKKRFPLCRTFSCAVSAGPFADIGSHLCMNQFVEPFQMFGISEHLLLQK